MNASYGAGVFCAIGLFVTLAMSGLGLLLPDASVRAFVGGVASGWIMIACIAAMIVGLVWLSSLWGG